MNLRRAMLSAGLAVLVATLAACATPSAGPVAADKGVFFANIKDRDTVSSPFIVKFGVRGMSLEPAMPVGELKENSGHHHVLINLDAIPGGQGIPFSDQHVHFGKAQTEGEFKLPPGKYKLTMQFANAAHVSYGPPMSATIGITVK